MLNSLKPKHTFKTLSRFNPATPMNLKPKTTAYFNPLLLRGHFPHPSQGIWVHCHEMACGWELDFCMPSHHNYYCTST